MTQLANASSPIGRPRSGHRYINERERNYGDLTYLPIRVLNCRVPAARIALAMLLTMQSGLWQVCWQPTQALAKVLARHLDCEE